MSIKVQPVAGPMPLMKLEDLALSIMFHDKAFSYAGHYYQIIENSPSDIRLAGSELCYNLKARTLRVVDGAAMVMPVLIETNIFYVGPVPIKP